MGAIHRYYKRSPRLRRATRSTKNGAVLALTKFGLWLSNRFSLESGLRFADRISPSLYRALAQPRQLAHEHIRLAYGDRLSPSAREQLAFASFANVCRSVIEIGKIDEIRARADEYFEIEGMEHAAALLARDRAAVIVTGHIGNWELLAAYCAWRGLPVCAIARRVYIPQINELLVKFRARNGVETILRETPGAARQMLRAIKDNAVLAMLIDQDTSASSVSVPFLGRSARTPAGAAALALRRDLPVFAAFIQRRPQGGHRIVLNPPFVIQRTGDRRADVLALTGQFNVALEKQILKNPTEWVWWHRRWRHAPMGHLDLDGDFEYTPQDVVLPGGG